MAHLTERLAENVDGLFYVDASCIDCQTCRIVAPRTFGALPRGLAYVHAQPGAPEDEERALMALASCPTSSIGTVQRRSAAAAARRFPEEILPDVFYCGFASESSYGASSYLIRRDEGNVLVDSPRAAGPLLDRIDALGGVRLLFLTHRDDVADHEKIRARSGCDRLLHEADVTRETRGVERRISGDAPVPLGPDLLAIPTPGHTAGSTCLLFRDVLFSGDHLWASESSGRLSASRSVCWYSWEEQVRSMERLLSHDFTTVLPGHGMRYLAPSVEAAREGLRTLVARMRERSPSAA